MKILKIKEPVRILHVLIGMNRAGAETMLMNLHRRIDKNLIQFDFAVCAENKCDYDDEIVNLGGRIIHYPRYKIFNHFKYIKFWDNFFKTHDEYKIIHGHAGSTAPLYLAAAKHNKKFTIAHSHNSNWIMPVPKFMYDLYSKRMHAITNYFLGCSMLALEVRYGAKTAHDISKARVLNNAIDTKKYIFNKSVRTEARRELNLSDNDFVLGTVGRLTPQKNPHKIIEILETLKNQGISYKFLWVGTGEMKAEIEKIIIENNLNENIKMLGVRDDIPRILQAMDVFILPSLYEGLPVVAIEAQAAGLPVLCSDRFETEAKITDLCKFLPINNADDNQKWLDEIMNAKNIIASRRDTSDEIKRAGFDINYTAEWLQSFYLNTAACNGGGGAYDLVILLFFIKFSSRYKNYYKNYKNKNYINEERCA